MAASLNGSVDFTQIALRIIESSYGIVFISILLLLITVGGFIYLLSKSGALSSFTTYTEYTSKKFHKEIEYKEELVNDASLSEFKDAIQHHIKVSKLENFLKHKNKDIDVLKYALSRMDSKRALKLYQRGKNYLTKDPETKIFKLKQGVTLEKIKRREIFALCIYAIFNLFGALPYLIQVIIILFKIKGVEWMSLSNQLFSFLVCLAISVMIVKFLFAPRAAQSFLEMEKI